MIIYIYNDSQCLHSLDEWIVPAKKTGNVGAEKIVDAHLMNFTNATPILISKTSLKDLDIPSSGSKANLCFSECCESVCLHGRPAALAFCSPKRSALETISYALGLCGNFHLDECKMVLRSAQDICNTIKTDGE